METLDEKLDRIKRNLESDIIFDTKRAEKKYRNGRNKLTSQSAIFRKKYCEILLESLNKDRKAFYKRVYSEGYVYSGYRDWPIIRQSACAVATCGRTMRVSSMTEEEIEKAKILLEKFTDEYMEDFRKKIAL